MHIRPPATPIINIDPYFSVWTETSVLDNPIHWTGSPNTMCGRVYVDDKEYHFFGLNDNSCLQMEIVDIEIDAYSTNITYANEQIRLYVCFTSPTLVEDFYYASRPVAYAKTYFESIDSKEHDVRVKFIVSEELVLSSRGNGRTVAEVVDIEGVTAIRIGNAEQKVLWRSGDNVRIDWGYLYLGTKGSGNVGQTILDDMCAIYAESVLENDALFLIAYDDIESIQYFGENLKAYWKKDGKSILEAIAESAEDYITTVGRCNEFSERIRKAAISKGNEKYAELLLLSVRQIMAAHKLVVDGEGNILFISKECGSNGCAATVDVTYPSAPFFLLYNIELLKAMLRPILKYSYSREWKLDFAPHDMGFYPLLNGQVYGVECYSDGQVKEIDLSRQMPLEECGNMIILFAAVMDAEKDTSFVKEHLGIIEQWSQYLIKYGLDPENQLCTDDFAGHLAHNVNLSIKAIMGIVGYSRILEKVGKRDEAKRMLAKARRYVESLIVRAKNPDGSFRLAYDQPNTFSLKYNAIWDKIWNTNLFPETFYQGEVARYKAELLPYGIPLDSRETYTKSDWILWVASFAESSVDFDLFVNRLWEAYNAMDTRVPMSDWYYADTANMREFRHRSVLGGLFIKLLLD